MYYLNLCYRKGTVDTLFFQNNGNKYVYTIIKKIQKRES